MSPAEHEPSSAPARLLIVDDVADNRAVLARRFERRGFQITEADGGLPALELLAEQAFDAVLLDVVMPDLSGTEVLKRVREKHAPAELPIIMVTAKAQSEDVVEALALGANDYVTKPVDFAIAFARVEAQVERKRAKEQLMQANASLIRQNEALRRAMEAAEAGTRAKAEFLNNMSHELKTPLNGVIGFAQLLARTDLDERQADFVENISTSASALVTLLTHVLDIATIGAHQELDVVSFDLEDAVRSAAAPYIRAAEAKGVSFSLELDQSLEPLLDTDPARLKKVLGSLLDNAVKFTDRGAVALTVTGGADGIRFQVRDTGVGFDEARKEKLFQRFVQGDSSLTRRFGGTGVGLSVARELAAIMGGSVDCTSQAGVGSVFTFELPSSRKSGNATSLVA